MMLPAIGQVRPGIDQVWPGICQLWPDIDRTLSDAVQFRAKIGPETGDVLFGVGQKPEFDREWFYIG